jgi:hypothetical protein
MAAYTAIPAKNQSTMGTAVRMTVSGEFRGL